MALACTHLGNANTSADGVGPFTGPTVSVTAGAIVIVHLENTKGSTPDVPTLTGGGLTWAQIANTKYNTVASPLHQVTSFWAYSDAGGSINDLTATFNGTDTQTALAWGVEQWTGANTTSPIVQSKTGNSNNVAVVTLALVLNDAISGTNGSGGVVALVSGAPGTLGSTAHTVLGTLVSHANPSGSLFRVAKTAGAQTVDFTWTNSAAAAGIVYEIRDAASTTVGTSTALRQGRRRRR